MTSNRDADLLWTRKENPSADYEREVEIQTEKSDNTEDSRHRSSSSITRKRLEGELRTIACPCCAHHVPINQQGGILHDLPGMPSGVRFDPTDVEILEHLEAKVNSDSQKLHPLIDEFIQTLEGETGICYTHPENLPGVRKDGVVRHYFHRPLKAYTTGSRKRRKVSNGGSEETEGSGGGSETRWHKTGKTRAVVVKGVVKGFKKILVLYSNYGRQKKPEKTSWVMHQYHLGQSEDEKDGELVLSKVFYQTQPRPSLHPQPPLSIQYQQPPQLPLMLQQQNSAHLQYYRQQQQHQPQYISFGHHDQSAIAGRLDSDIPNLGAHDRSIFITPDDEKEQLQRHARPATTTHLNDF